MNRTTRFAHALVAVAALASTALLIASCARKPTAVDPTHTTPEGTASELTRLMVWPERPAVTALYTDNAPFGPDPGDLFVGMLEYFEHPAGTLNGMVLDGSIASQFEILRREANGGIRPLFDFPLPPTRRWPDAGWDSFRFTDSNPLQSSTPGYVARGLVDGRPTTYSPLSNFAELLPNDLGTIQLRFPTDTTGTWDPVPGAAYYVSHLFQFRQATPNDRVLASAPKPLFIGKSLDIFIGISTEPRVVGRNQPFDGHVVTRRELLPGHEYQFTVSAIDSRGELIARSIGDSATVQSEVTYERYAQGAAILPRPHGVAGVQRLYRP